MGFLLSMESKPYWNVTEVAKYFGIKPATVYRLTQRGILPGFKVGNQWRFSQKMLEGWVADRVSGAFQGYAWMKADRVDPIHPKRDTA
jgi:excisionase family DNA binding protein